MMIISDLYPSRAVIYSGTERSVITSTGVRTVGRLGAALQLPESLLQEYRRAVPVSLLRLLVL